MKRLLTFTLLILLTFTGIGYAQTTGYIYDFSQKLEWRVAKHTSTAFTGGVADQHGNAAGTNNPYTIFVATGDTIVYFMWGVVNTTLVGANSLQVGVAGQTAAMIGVIADATDLVSGDLFHGNGLHGANAGQANNVAYQWTVINNGVDIIETAGGNITAGQIDYYILWAPVEVGASIVSATPTP